jgi:TRAP-type C4-dicarboxylate transport system permease small subunit
MPGDPPRGGSPTPLPSATPVVDAPSVHTRFVLRAVALAELFYRSIGLTFLIAGWLGELAIITARNLVSYEPAWTVEMVTVSLMYGALLYVGVVPRHIGFRLVADRLQRASRFAGLIEPVLSLAIVVLFTFEAIRAVQGAAEIGGSSGIAGFDYPLWILYITGPVFGAVFCLKTIGRIWHEVGRDNPDDVTRPGQEEDGKNSVVITDRDK